jgi:acetyl esterase/lipase
LDIQEFAEQGARGEGGGRIGSVKRHFRRSSREDRSDQLPSRRPLPSLIRSAARSRSSPSRIKFSPKSEAARSAFEWSPLYDLSRRRAPVLLVHGDDHRNVPFAESATLAEELRRLGIPVETLVFPDEVHSFLLW